ncbi:MAG: Gfo/Idh/MocA family protein [Anaerolineales bacterium]
MTEDTFRLVLIGAGGIARRHIEAMEDLRNRGLDDFTLTAVCDIDEEAARERGTQAEEVFGQRPVIYTDYQQLLDQEEAHGADLCLPHGLHHEVSIDCMEAGLHVLCEKPLGVTIKASRLMAKKADETGLVLSTAVPYRRLPGHRKAAWVLNESGLVGRPLSFFHYYARPRQRRPDDEPVPQSVVWRQDRLMSGGGMVMDSGFHYCDGMRHLLGEVDTVFAETRQMASGRPLPLEEAREDTVFVTFTFENGAVGSWTWSLAAPGNPVQELIFYGSEGSLRDTTDNAYTNFHLFFETGEVVQADGTRHILADLEADYRASLTDREWERYYPHGVDDGFAYEIWEFIEAARGNREGVEVNGWEGLRSLAVCEAIYESALTGEPIAVEDVVSGERDRYQQSIDAHWGL